MVTTLHITNGDVIASRLLTMGFSEVLPWREMLNEGKVSAYTLLQGALVYQEVNHERAQFISTEGSGSYQDVLNTLNTQTEQLLQTNANEIVLWFESDLYDMLLLSQICCILNTKNNLNSTIFLLQTVGHIHKLSDKQFVEAYENRTPINAQYFQQLCEFWDVFTTPQQIALQNWVSTCENSEIQVLQLMAVDIRKLFLTSHSGLSGIEAMVQKYSENYTDLQQALGDRNFVTNSVFERITRRLSNLEESTDRYFGSYWIDDILR